MEINNYNQQYFTSIVKTELLPFSTKIIRIKNTLLNEYTNIGNTCYMIHLFFNLNLYLYIIKQANIVLQKS
jgi:hypothetical protein